MHKAFQVLKIMDGCDTIYILILYNLGWHKLIVCENIHILFDTVLEFQAKIFLVKLFQFQNIFWIPNVQINVSSENSLIYYKISEYLSPPCFSSVFSILVESNQDPDPFQSWPATKEGEKTKELWLKEPLWTRSVCPKVK